MIKHEEIIYIPAKEYDKINRLLDIECFEDMTDEELEEQDVKEDYCEGIFEVKFDDGSYLTWDLCSGQSNYYDNVVWTSTDGKNDITFECAFELDDIEFEINSELYIVKVIRG